MIFLSFTSYARYSLGKIPSGVAENSAMSLRISTRWQATSPPVTHGVRGRRPAAAAGPGGARRPSPNKKANKFPNINNAPRAWCRGER